MSGHQIQRFDQQGVQRALDALHRALGTRTVTAAPSRQASGGGVVLAGGGSFGSSADTVGIEDVDGLRDELQRLEALVTSGGGSVPPATTMSLGTVKLSYPAADAANPVALGANDPALQGMKSLTHYQSTASDVWTIYHSLGFVPSIDVVDSGGNTHEPAIAHDPPTAPTLTVLTFFHPTSGVARLS